MRSRPLRIAYILLHAELIAAAADSAKPVQFQSVRVPPFDEIVTGTRKWEKQFPDRLKVEEAGRSKEDRPILLCHITDWSVPDHDKQRIFFSSMHSGEIHVSRFDLDAMHRMVCTKHRPNVGLYFSSGHGLGQPTYEPLRHGLTLQIYIPYPNAKITEIRLDGYPIHRSPTEGYGIYHSPGTVVEAAIPPGKAQHLHILTVLFDGGVERKQGFAREDWQIK